MAKQRKSRKRNRQKMLLIVSAVVVCVILAATAGVFYSFRTAVAEKGGMLYVRPGMTADAFADTLAVRFGEKLSDHVMLLSKIKNLDLSHRVGAYQIEKGATSIEVWRKVSMGAQTPVKFTFNNMRTVEEFAEAASQELAMTKEGLLPLLCDSAKCAERGFTPQTIPAMLIPDTYEVYWSVSPSGLLDKLQQSYEQFWNAARLEKARKIGLSPVEVATLASIVDSETANNAEKGTIARLYLNRIERGIKLQSDPTVKFAVGDNGLRRILNKHLAVDSPYNTYMYEGLPPGPIRFPEKRTLEAVLDAPENNYLYMCAKEDFSGSHRFTASYSEHLANARRYQQELNKRGIR